MRTDIVDELEALATHYPRLVLSDEQRVGWLKDYLEDLNALPIDAIRLGCRQWRKSAARKFPTIGELLAACRAHVRETRDTFKAWTPLSDQEYQALSLSDKIRHHTILAGQCEAKAGPQCKDKRPVPADDMPASWHEWRARAKNHYAEASALREALGRYRETQGAA
jgi:hypothetical protein